MTWTSTKPTAPGWYWLKNADYRNGTIVCVTEELRVARLGSERLDMLAETDGEWTGQIDRPTAPLGSLRDRGATAKEPESESAR